MLSSDGSSLTGLTKRWPPPAASTPRNGLRPRAGLADAPDPRLATGPRHFNAAAEACQRIAWGLVTTGRQPTKPAEKKPPGRRSE
jgi:hypothetical protein